MKVDGRLVRPALAGLAILVAGAVAVLVVVRGGDAVTRSRTGADPAAALNEVPDVPDDLETVTTWQPDDPDTGRELEPATRRDLAAAVTRAWLQLGISHEAGRDIALETLFSDSALDAAREAVTTRDLVRLDVHAHELTLHLYSADGVIVSLTDEVTLTRYVRLPDQPTGGAGTSRVRVRPVTTTDTYDVIAFLDDGNWRIQHLVRRASRPATPPPAATTS